MDVQHEDVRSVSGAYFQITGVHDFINESGKISYMLYLKTGNDVAALHKFIRMFAIPYRMVLIDEGDKESIGFVLFGNEEEREQMDSIMDWISISHPEWMVINCQEEIDIPSIIGYRIANNLFHARKLSLQGEILD